MLIGYVRVSKTDGSQVLDPQRDTLFAAGVTAEQSTRTWHRVGEMTALALSPAVRRCGRATLWLFGSWIVSAETCATWSS